MGWRRTCARRGLQFGKAFEKYAERRESKGLASACKVSTLRLVNAV